MAHWTEDLEDICDKVTEELADAKKKLDKNGGKMSAGDIDYIDKLTHTLKSIKTTLAMDEYSDDYSGARGRGRNARRDSIGRYSSDIRYSNADGYGGRYSHDDARHEMMEHLRELEMSAPDDRTRRMVQEWKRQAERE